MEQQQTQGDILYMDGILSRLLEHFLSGEPLPDKEQDVISPVLFHRLARCVVGEGYGQ